MTDKDLISTSVDDKTLMEYYYGQSITENINKYRNVLRNDVKGNCSFRRVKGKLYFIDYAKQRRYDIYDFVMQKYNCDYRECLSIIMKDFKIKPDYNSKEKIEKLAKIKADNLILTEQVRKKKSFKYVTRKYGVYDKHFWTRFKISIDVLKKYNVQPIDKLSIFLDNKFKYLEVYSYDNDYDSICYCIKIGSNVKFYRPMAKIELSQKKWISNTDIEDCYGFDVLNLENSGPIIVASGLKDMLCLSQMGYDVIAPMSECNNLPKRVVEALKSSDRDVFYLFDTDRAGLINGVKYGVLNAFKAIWLPKVGNWKDVADFVENIGLEETKNIINLLIELNYA